MNSRDNREVIIQPVKGRQSGDLVQKLEKGVDTIADVVKTTLGPKGRNVLLERKYGVPAVTKDGVTVAKEIFLEDSDENMAAQLVKEAAVRTNEVSGDGTTTATLLAQTIFHSAIKEVEAGRSPVDVKRDIDEDTARAIAFLKEKSRPVSGEELKEVATISANDKRVGELVFGVLGDDPTRVVTIEESAGMALETERVDGLRVEKGFLSPVMITDQERSEAVLDDTFVLVANGKISVAEEIGLIMQICAMNNKKSLFVIADDVDGDALATLAVNKIRGTFSSVAVKAPGFGETKTETLKDIAAVTGAVVVGGETGLTIDKVKLEHLGRARRVVATKDHTTVVDGSGVKEKIEARIKEVKNLLENAESQFDKDKLSQRLAKLSGGVAVIRVGAPTETEVKELKDRVEDAVQATTAAAEEGVLPGAGNALYCASYVMDKSVLREALKAPHEQILVNAGLACGPISWDRGIDSRTGEGVESLMSAGIIDPTKVTRTALENPASIAGQLVMASAAVTFKKKTEGRERDAERV